jgi:hypothetical protein
LKLLNDRKGQIRVIEALFASLLLLSSLALIPAPQKPSHNSLETLSSKAMQVLVTLESDGHLSNLVDERNWTAIRSYVQSFVPVTLWFNLTVFDEEMAPLNSVQMCSGTAISENVASADCVIASTSSSFAVYTVRLQLATVE